MIWGLLQEVETKAKHMEEEIGKLQKRLEQRNVQLDASTSKTEKVPTNIPLLYNFQLAFHFGFGSFLLGHDSLIMVASFSCLS